MSDTKGVDTSVATAVISSTNTNHMSLVNGLAAGSGSYNRIGRKAKMHSLRVRGNWRHVMGPSGGGVATGGILRMVVVWDRQPSGAQPTFDTIFGHQTSDGTEVGATVLAPPKFDNMRRFKVLRDKTFTSAPGRNYTGRVSQSFALSTTGTRTALLQNASGAAALLTTGTRTTSYGDADTDGTLIGPLLPELTVGAVELVDGTGGPIELETELKDRTIDVTTVTEDSTTTGTLETAGELRETGTLTTTGSSTQTQVGSLQEVGLIDEFIKLDGYTTVYSGSDSTISSISSGGLYVIFRALVDQNGVNEFHVDSAWARLRYFG